MMATQTQVDRRQSDVLAAIINAIRQTGRPPTVREIGDACAISSTSVVDFYLGRLERDGRIRRDREVSRGVWPVIDGGCCPFCGAVPEAQQWRIA